MREMIRAFTVAIIITAMLPLISVNSYVYGQDVPKKETFRFDGYVARAVWDAESEDGSLDFGYVLSVEYNKKDRTTTVVLTRATFTPDGSFVKEEFAIETFQDRVFAIDSKLTSATLSTVSLDMRECDSRGFCPPTGEVLDVQASWTGEGPLTKGDVRVKESGPISDELEVSIKTSRNAISRGASATISINGQEYQSDSASLLQDSLIEVTRFKII